MKIITLLFFLVPNIALSALYGYCFPKATSLDKTIKHLQKIKSPKDSLHKRSSINCLEVDGSLRMFELYRKYLASNFRILRSYKGANAALSETRSIQKGMCRIKITKTEKEKVAENKVKFGRKKNLRHSEKTKQVNSVSNMVLSYGKKASLRVNDESIGVSCTKSGNGFEMGFNLQGKSNNLSSNAFIASGGKLDLGKIVTELNEKKRSISINDGMRYHTNKSQTVFSYTLEVQ